MTDMYLPPVVARLEADIGPLLAAIEQAKAAMKSFGDASSNIKFNVDQSSFNTAMAKAKALQATLPSEIVKIKAETDGGSFAAAGAAAAGLARTMDSTTRSASSSIPVWHRWLDLIHFGFAAFGENLVADTIGVAAFGISAVAAFQPVVETLGNMGQTYGYMNRQQQAATDAIQGFLNKFRGASNTGVFAVFYGLLDMVDNKLNQTGGVTRQATQAFEFFTASLQRDFSSPQWAAVFGRSSSLVRTDLETLMRTLSSFIQLIPGLLHDFNFLGLGILNGATLIFKALSYLSEADPNLTRFIYLAYLAERAWRYLWTGMGTGAGPIQRAAMSIRTLMGAFQGAAATGAAADIKILGVNIAGLVENFKQFGALPTIAMTLGPVGGVVAAVGALAAVVVGLYLATRNWDDATGHVIDTVTKMNQANQDSLTVWEKGQQMLARQQQALGLTGKTYGQLTHSIMGAHDATTTYNADADRIDGAMSTQDKGITNLKQNYAYLAKTYGLTSQQAQQLAKVVGVNLSGVLGGTGKTALANYEQALKAAKDPLTAIQYDMQGAANSAIQLDDRVTYLTNAFNAMLTPFANVIQDTVQWKNDNLTLAADLKKSGDQVGYNTAAQRTSAAQLATVIQDTERLSQDTLQQTGSIGKATAAIQKEITFLEGLHSKSTLVTSAIRILERYMNALHSRSVNVYLQGHGQFGLSTGLQHQLPGPRAARGAYIGMGSSSTADDVLARVSRGELIVPAHMVKAGAVNHLRGKIPGFAAGGFVPSYNGNVGGLGPWATQDVNAVTGLMAKAMRGDMQAAIQSAMGGPSGGRTSAGGTYNRAMLERLWQQAGGPGGYIALIAAAIALAESGGSPIAHNPSGASGLWQILGQVYPGNIFNPYTNALNAVMKYDQAGHNFSPWVTYTTGAYRAFMDNGGYLQPGLNIIGNNTGQPERVLAPGEHENIVIENHLYLDGKELSVAVQRQARRYNRRNGPRGAQAWDKPA